jgi:NitT/TauT family transport system ATP-binding protein
VSLHDEIVIEAANVSRCFRRADGQQVDALSNISFRVPRGQFVCLVGPSGCGKSTLLQIIAGLLPPSAGTLMFENEGVTGPGAERGMVFQKDSVFPWMRVIDNVEYGLACRGVAKAERRVVAGRYLDRVGLAHVAQAWPRELSGGMLKRVAVATVFANGARVLLLDEPFGALDYVTKRQLHDVLLALWAETDGRRTVMFVTHDVDEALILADRILVLHTGRIVDDLIVEARRPRSIDTLLAPQMVHNRHVLLAHLGLETVRLNASDKVRL